MAQQLLSEWAWPSVKCYHNPTYTYLVTASRTLLTHSAHSSPLHPPSLPTVHPPSLSFSLPPSHPPSFSFSLPPSFSLSLPLILHPSHSPFPLAHPPSHPPSFLPFLHLTLPPSHPPFPLAHPPSLLPSLPLTLPSCPPTLHSPHGCPSCSSHSQITLNIHWLAVHQIELQMAPQNVQQVLYDVCTIVKEIDTRLTKFWLLFCLV